ncbi:hypothetical protein ACVBEG_27335 [Pseudomonas sp. GG8]
MSKPALSLICRFDEHNLIRRSKPPKPWCWSLMNSHPLTLVEEQKTADAMLDLVTSTRRR